MPKPQRKEEILKSELPPTLPLMALRSTIVYPLGTIAVQMGAPENLALLRGHEEAGLVVALVVAGGDHDDPIDSQRFIGRVGVAARVHERINLPGDTVQITLQGLRRIVVEGIDRNEPYPVAAIRAAKETPADPAELDDLVTRVVSAADTTRVTRSSSSAGSAGVSFAARIDAIGYGSVRSIPSTTMRRNP
jgi:ATP-dependent Lon protease